MTAILAASANAEVIRKQSQNSVKDTIGKLEAVVKERGLTVFARIDHAAGARSAGLELRPTELLIFGNPKTGTPLMQAQQIMGLSLPLKVLAWQDADGNVWIGYDSPASVAADRDVARDNPVIGQVTQALNGLTDIAIKP
jgi:uncharacterized protein (DUF302 family)